MTGAGVREKPKDRLWRASPATAAAEGGLKKHQSMRHTTKESLKACRGEDAEISPARSSQRKNPGQRPAGAKCCRVKKVRYRKERCSDPV